MSDDLDELVDAACRARENAYAPYSSFRVGAAVRADDGQLFSGCNVENASYGGTICAERSAILAMVAAGRQRIAAIAVFTDADTLAMPCGLCRQVISEFQRGARVIVANPRERRTLEFDALFPEPFVLDR